ncbi:MAG: ribosome biogenesis/translation initiation ATPase RLI [Candidatus Aenigmatarchaeota archaeon]|nr:MAG: ribosome biogenesis/translation initiation ATPase RLI [Candidatus Aenigmarchaeota archaeon]
MKANRIAVIDRDLCNPKSCGLYLCQRVCPVNRKDEDCITVSEIDRKPLIDESLCIGCGICVKKCPRNAIEVVNLPEKLEETPIHRYGKNLFSLFRLPIPKTQAVVGLIGPNGVGKTTVLNILSGSLRPNTGVFETEIPWQEIIERFKGTELQDYMGTLAKEKIKTGYKPQHVDLIPKKWSGKVKDLLEEAKGDKDVVSRLKMEEMFDKDIENLSGGELQLLAIAATIMKDCDFYFFDEPSSYLDVEQRLRVAKEIRKLCEKAVVMVVEHDLAVADYLADYTHILYGKPGVFGIVSKPYGVRIGINTYLEGYIREENMRFRPEPIFFSRRARASDKDKLFLQFSGFEKAFESFSLETEPGNLYKGEIIGILGPNAIGKTTFIKMLVGILKPDKGEPLKELKLSYKPQRVVLKKEEENMKVEDYLKERSEKISDTESKRILRFLGVERLLERLVGSLSGGELQSVFIASSLLEEHDLILMDEPSAFLDVEQRLRVAKLIREHAEGKEIPCFVVDHDLQFIDAIADRVILFEGEPGVKGKANPICTIGDGINQFLKSLDITYRRDPNTGRPRANKPGSQKDIEQKNKRQYYYME